MITRSRSEIRKPGPKRFLKKQSQSLVNKLLYCPLSCHKLLTMDTTITKQKMVEAIKDLPDDTTSEQAITELVRLAKGRARQSADWEDLPEAAKEGIEAVLADVKAGRVPRRGD